MIKMKIKIEIAFKIKTKKVIAETIKKKYHARRRFTRSPATGPNMVKSGRQQKVFKKKVKCYNCQKLRHYANDCFESDHKQQKNVKKQ